MDNTSNHAIHIAPEDGVTLRRGSAGVNWYMLLFVVIGTLFAVYWGFVQPTSRQLAKMRRYVASLEKSISELNGQRGTADQTATLLDQLVRQRDANAKASAALAEMSGLHSQLVREGTQLRAATQAVQELVALRNRVSQQVALIEATDQALASINDLHRRICDSASNHEDAQLALGRLDGLTEELVDSIDKLDEASPVVARVDSLHSRLIAAGARTEGARRAQRRPIRPPGRPAVPRR